MGRIFKSGKVETADNDLEQQIWRRFRDSLDRKRRRTGKIIKIKAHTPGKEIDFNDYFQDSECSSLDEDEEENIPPPQKSLPNVEQTMAKPQQLLQRQFIGRRTGALIKINARLNSDGLVNVDDYFLDSSSVLSSGGWISEGGKEKSRSMVETSTPVQKDIISDKDKCIQDDNQDGETPKAAKSVSEKGTSPPDSEKGQATEENTPVNAANESNLAGTAVKNDASSEPTPQFFGSKRRLFASHGGTPGNQDIQPSSDPLYRSEIGVDDHDGEMEEVDDDKKVVTDDDVDVNVTEVTQHHELIDDEDIEIDVTGRSDHEDGYGVGEAADADSKCAEVDVTGRTEDHKLNFETATKVIQEEDDDDIEIDVTEVTQQHENVHIDIDEEVDESDADVDVEVTKVVQDEEEGGIVIANEEDYAMETAVNDMKPGKKGRKNSRKSTVHKSTSTIVDEEETGSTFVTLGNKSKAVASTLAGDTPGERSSYMVDESVVLEGTRHKAISPDFGVSKASINQTSKSIYISENLEKNQLEGGKKGRKSAAGQTGKKKSVSIKKIPNNDEEKCLRRSTRQKGRQGDGEDVSVHDQSDMSTVKEKGNKSIKDGKKAGNTRGRKTTRGNATLGEGEEEILGNDDEGSTIGTCQQSVDKLPNEESTNAQRTTRARKSKRGQQEMTESGETQAKEAREKNREETYPKSVHEDFDNECVRGKDDQEPEKESTLKNTQRKSRSARQNKSQVEPNDNKKTRSKSVNASRRNTISKISTRNINPDNNGEEENGGEEGGNDEHEVGAGVDISEQHSPNKTRSRSLASQSKEPIAASIFENGEVLDNTKQKRRKSLAKGANRTIVDRVSTTLRSTIMHDEMENEEDEEEQSSFVKGKSSEALHSDQEESIGEQRTELNNTKRRKTLNRTKNSTSQQKENKSSCSNDTGKAAEKDADESMNSSNVFVKPGLKSTKKRTRGQKHQNKTQDVEVEMVESENTRSRSEENDTSHLKTANNNRRTKVEEVVTSKKSRRGKFGNGNTRVGNTPDDSQDDSDDNDGKRYEDDNVDDNAHVSDVSMVPVNSMIQASANSNDTRISKKGHAHSDSDRGKPKTRRKKQASVIPRGLRKRSKKSTSNSTKTGNSSGSGSSSGESTVESQDEAEQTSVSTVQKTIVKHATHNKNSTINKISAQDLDNIPLEEDIPMNDEVPNASVPIAEPRRVKDIRSSGSNSSTPHMTIPPDSAVRKSILKNSNQRPTPSTGTDPKRRRVSIVTNRPETDTPSISPPPTGTQERRASVSFAPTPTSFHISPDDLTQQEIEQPLNLDGLSFVTAGSNSYLSDDNTFTPGNTRLSTTSSSSGSGGGESRLESDISLENEITINNVKRMDEEDGKDGPRRSKRTKVHPLKYWKNEKIQYGRRRSGWFVKGVETHPTPKVEKRKKSSAPKKKVPNTLSSKSSNFEDISQEMLDAPEGFHEEVNPSVTVINPETKEEVMANLLHTPGMLNFLNPSRNPAKSSDPLIVDKYMSHNIFGCGQLVLRGNAEKGKVNVRRDTMVFFLLKGWIEVTLHQSQARLGPGSTFFVPEGNSYNIKNLESTDARLFFVQVKG